MSHTFATLEVSPQTYGEIRAALESAGYDHAFMPDGAIDMHGIGLVKMNVCRGRDLGPCEGEPTETVWKKDPHLYDRTVYRACKAHVAAAQERENG